jgi:hypothetical protein
MKSILKGLLSSFVYESKIATLISKKKPYMHKKKAPSVKKELSGEKGIRTPGALAGTAVFETAPFDHSGISPVMSQK